MHFHITKILCATVHCATSKAAFSIIFIISMTNFSKCVYLAAKYCTFPLLLFGYICSALPASCSVFLIL